MATSDGRSIEEISEREPGASVAPSIARLAAKATRCADLSRDLGAGIARTSALTPEQRIGLARAFDAVHAALAQAAAVVGYAPLPPVVVATKPEPQRVETSGFTQVVDEPTGPEAA